MVCLVWARWKEGFFLEILQRHGVALEAVTSWRVFQEPDQANLLRGSR